MTANIKYFQFPGEQPHKYTLTRAKALKKSPAGLPAIAKKKFL